MEKKAANLRGKTHELCKYMELESTLTAGQKRAKLLLLEEKLSNEIPASSKCICALVPQGTRGLHRRSGRRRSEGCRTRQAWRFCRSEEPKDYKAAPSRPLRKHMRSDTKSRTNFTHANRLPITPENRALWFNEVAVRERLKTQFSPQLPGTAAVRERTVTPRSGASFHTPTKSLSTNGTKHEFPAF